MVTVELDVNLPKRQIMDPPYVKLQGRGSSRVCKHRPSLSIKTIKISIVSEVSLWLNLNDRLITYSKTSRQNIHHHGPMYNVYSNDNHRKRK